jgi:hypothetical protein
VVEVAALNFSVGSSKGHFKATERSSNDVVARLRVSDDADPKITVISGRLYDHELKAFADWYARYLKRGF